MRLGVVVRREVARGEKTAEDQGVPWTKTRVCDGVVESVRFEERSVYLISQLSWWKDDGSGIEVGVGVVVRRSDMLVKDSVAFSVSLVALELSVSLIIRQEHLDVAESGC